MTSILILTYHFTPDNIIAARRSEAYARHFSKFGIFPTIVTDLYEPADGNNPKEFYKNHTAGTPVGFEKFPTHHVIRIPRLVTPLQRFQQKIQKYPLLSRAFTLLMHMRGHFDMHLLGHYYNYRKFLWKHLSEHSYDLILAVDSPHFHVRLTRELYKKFSIPYVCDFRDLYDNHILCPDYKPIVKIRFINWLKRKYFRSWLKHSTFLTATSIIWANYYGKLANVNADEITNGFEADDFNIDSGPVFRQKFILAHTGRIYQNQNWEIILRGIQLFLQKAAVSDCEVVFAGVRQDASDVVEFIKKYLPEGNLRILPWLPREEVRALQQRASILFVASWEGTVGVYSGKIFEYLGARKPILFAPGDGGGVVDLLLKETGAGVSVNRAYEVCTFVYSKYQEWKNTGKVSYEGEEEKIMQYSRENQVKKMAKLIKNALEIKNQ